MSRDPDKEWSWKTPGFHNYVRICDDERLEWGQWEDPGEGGGATYQSIEDFLRTGKAGYDWTEPPEEVLEALRDALST